MPTQRCFRGDSAVLVVTFPNVRYLIALTEVPAIYIYMLLLLEFSELSGQKLLKRGAFLFTSAALGARDQAHQSDNCSCPPNSQSSQKWAPVTCPKLAEVAQAHPMRDGHCAGQEWAWAFEMGFTYAPRSRMVAPDTSKSGGW